MSYQDNRQSMIPALRISAIDVLCCAMVASFVLFLVLSSQPVRRMRASGKGKAASTIHVQLSVNDPATIVSLNLIPPQGGGDAIRIPAALYTDQSANPAAARAAADTAAGILKGGGWNWVAFPDWGKALLVLEKPVNGQWKADISYAHGESLQDVKVTVQLIGSCEFAGK